MSGKSQPTTMTVGSLIKALQKFDINLSVRTDTLQQVIDVKATKQVVFIITPDQQIAKR
jgi:hypothetical protein